MGEETSPREAVPPPIASIGASPVAGMTMSGRPGDSGAKPAMGPAARVEATSSPESTDAANWPPDDSVELEYLSTAGVRDKPAGKSIAGGEAGDEGDAKELPPLNELVDRIPPEVRDLLDELFRAKFTTVRRIPRNALKDAVG